MKSLVLFSCFIPLVMIYVIMKLSVWMSAINDEHSYVRRESRKPHGPYVENAYADVDAKEEEYGSSTDYQ